MKIASIAADDIVEVDIRGRLVVGRVTRSTTGSCTSGRHARVSAGGTRSPARSSRTGARPDDVLTRSRTRPTVSRQLRCAGSCRSGERVAVSSQSAIEWYDATWNVVTGCDRTSPGCAHCYAIETASRLRAMGVPKYTAARDGGRASGPAVGVTLHPGEPGRPRRWRRPRRSFVDSMGDLFHQEVPLSSSTVCSRPSPAARSTSSRSSPSARTKCERTANSATR